MPSETLGKSTKGANYTRAKFCGRRDELTVLQKAFDEIHYRPLSLFLEGEPGCGKSTLIFAFSKLILNNRVCCFCRGKFEQGRSASAPFAAILQALSELMSQILEHEGTDTWRDRFEQELSDIDARTIQHLMPEIELFETSGTDDSSSFSLADLGFSGRSSSRAGASRYDTNISNERSVSNYNRTEDMWRFDRLRFAIRSVIRVVSKHMPVVLFLDDLQWAGEDSLVMIHTILSDMTRDRHLLFIGTFRSVTQAHPLRQLLLSKVDSMMGGSIIQLQNLSELDVSELLTSYFSVHDEDVRSLVKVVHAKTEGNPFFLIQFLRLLEQRGLFFVNGHGHWQWDSQAIHSEATRADTVADVVRKKMKLMPLEHQKIITYASFFGTSEFSARALFDALHNPPSSTKKEEEETKLDTDEYKTYLSELHSMVEGGYLEVVEPVRPFGEEFRFVHDRIREGAYSFIASPVERANLHIHIGRQLLRRHEASLVDSSYSKRRQDMLLLNACHQINLGANVIEEEDDLDSFVRLNYQAAELAAYRSGYFLAVQLLASGLKLISKKNAPPQLETNRAEGFADYFKAAWKNHYGCMLKLCSAMTRMEYACGHLEECLAYSEEILANAHYYMDRKVAHYAKIFCLCKTHREAEARDFVLSVLKENGQVFPRRWHRLHVTLQFVKIMVTVRRKPDEQLSQLPAAKHPENRPQDEFLEELCELTYVSSQADSSLYTLALLRLAETSLKYGSLPSTSVAFVGLGIIMAKRGNFRDAIRLGNVGLEYARSRQAQGSSTLSDIKAMCLFHFYIGHWQSSYHETTNALFDAIQEYWKLEATSFVMVDTALYLVGCFCSGSRLGVLLDAVKKQAELLMDDSHRLLYANQSSFFQLVANLTGLSENTVKLTGDFLDEDQALERQRSDPNAASYRKLQLCRIIAACFFGDFSTSDSILSELRVEHLKGPGMPLPLASFFEGLTALSVVRSSLPTIGRRRELLRKGRREIRRLDGWLRKGAVNCASLVAILRAEDQAVAANTYQIDTVLDAYDHALSVLGELPDGYYLHLRALANERAGVFCVEKNRRTMAAKYLTEAQSLYTDWGSMAKVRQLSDKYRGTLDVKDASSNQFTQVSS